MLFIKLSSNIKYKICLLINLLSNNYQHIKFYDLISTLKMHNVGKNS
jgi:hypothetical protein